MDTQTLEIFTPKCKDWNCDNGRKILSHEWTAKIKAFKAKYMLTVTTRWAFTPNGMEHAKKAIAPFLRSLKYRNIKYISVMGAAQHEKIHFHIACKGEKPSIRWIKQKWHKLTGCYYVHIEKWHSNLPAYLVWSNAAQIPNHKEGKTAWITLEQPFRRIQTSARLFPSKKQKQAADPDRYLHLDSDEPKYIEHLRELLTLNNTHQTRQQSDGKQSTRHHPGISEQSDGPCDTQRKRGTGKTIWENPDK